MVFVDGGRLCGQLPGLPSTADPATVRAAVQEMLEFVVEDDAAVELHWRSAADGWSATIEVGPGTEDGSAAAFEALADALSGAYHQVILEFGPVIELEDGLPLREPLPQVVRSISGGPVGVVRPIMPVTRWVPVFGEVVTRVAAFGRPPEDFADQLSTVIGVIESELGEVRIAVHTELSLDDYDWCAATGFVFFSRSHAARLLILVSD